jgi:SAM-dependent methyltransferase
MLSMSDPPTWGPREDQREPLRRTFDSAADRYDAARPDYPEELFDDLVRVAGLEPGARLLEIGCATGKATLPLLRRGFSVVCVELGPELADQARRNLIGLPVEINVEPFETWQNPAGAFDLVFAATSWHWVDPELRYRKAHELLRPGGHLAFWGAVHECAEGSEPLIREHPPAYVQIGEC